MRNFLRESSPPLITRYDYVLGLSLTTKHSIKKSNRNYTRNTMCAEACNEWRDPSSWLSNTAPEKRRSSG